MLHSTEHVHSCSADRVHADLKQVCLVVLMTTMPKMQTFRGTSGAEHERLSWVTLQSALFPNMRGKSVCFVNECTQSQLSKLSTKYDKVL